MNLELFLLLCIVILWLSVQGYLEPVKRSIYRFSHTLSFFSQTSNSEFFRENAIVKLIVIAVLLLILFPKLLKLLLSPFRANKTENNPVKIIQEYNFVNSIRDITDKAKEKTENWTESRKKIIVKSQRDKCFDCSLTMETPYLTHKIPLHRGGTNDMSNLKALCEGCYFRAEIQNSYL